MRRWIALLLGCSLTLPAFAADETLFGDDYVWNLFTRLDVKHSDIGIDDGFIGGVQVGGILNDRLAIGLGGYGLLDKIQTEPNGYDNPKQFDIMYGGLTLEYRLFAHKLLHASLGTLVGVGKMDLTRTADGKHKEIDLFVVEPQLSLIINITAASEFGIGLGYRHADPDEDVKGLEKDDLSGFVATLFVRLTEF
ncbi:MAG TPA: hypothetical protein PKE12_06785 [Kiritimatiellia bacterium]|nr:hypothetical protein [Kiritimatiellia bacterium]